MQQDNSFAEILDSFSIAMLVTLESGNRMRARPMILVSRDGDATIWFATHRDSVKLLEIRKCHDVCVTAQSDEGYLAVQGLANIVDDPAKIGQLWQETWRTWFPQGKLDPGIVLIRTDCIVADYWKGQELTSSRYTFAAGKAFLTETAKQPRMESTNLHETIDFS